MVWLVEIKISTYASYSLQQYLGFYNTFISPMMNKRGRFCLVWIHYIEFNFMLIRNVMLFVKLLILWFLMKKLFYIVYIFPYYHDKTKTWLSPCNLFHITH